jgi:3-phenylpropionate/cinnamic acid dioxygenase small subunit
VNATTVSAQDHAEIQNLYARYNHCSDAGDAEGYAACFTADGALEIEPRGFRVEGRANLTAYKAQEAAGRAGRYRRHWNGSLHLERIGADTVRGRCYFQGFNGRPGELPVFCDAGVYEDTIVRVDGAWLFARRRLAIDGSRPLPPPATP